MWKNGYVVVDVLLDFLDAVRGALLQNILYIIHVEERKNCFQESA